MPTEFFNRAGASAVQRYLEQVIDFIEENSILPAVARKKFADDVRLGTENATTYADTYPSITAGIKNLSVLDGHSGFHTPTTWQTFMDTDQALPSGHMIGQTAYVKVPGYSVKTNSNSTEEYIAAGGAYVAHLQNLIADLDRHKPSGWVIDLRANSGGSSWPMLAGLGPLWEGGNNQNGLLGSFVTRKGTEPWGYENGEAWNTALTGERYTAARLPDDMPVYHLHNPNAPVAVLSGPSTMSAGETQVIAAYSCRPRMKVFGQDSAGMATGNNILTGSLHDEAKVILAASTYADASGKKYGYVLQPDEQALEAGPNDPVPAAALAWLKNPVAPLASSIPLRPMP